MLQYLISILSNSNSPYALFAVICLIGFVWVGRTLISEKDKELDESKGHKEDITLILSKVDSIKEEILIYLQNHKSA
jgi:hypothetical protein